MSLYLRFGNEEFVWVDQLIPSRGVDARNAQARKAASVRPTSPEPSCPAAHAQTATKIVEKVCKLLLIVMGWS